MPEMPATVDIWWWLTSGPDGPDRPADPSVLGPAEHATAARLPPHRAAEYIAYRSAVRHTLGHLLGASPASLAFGRRPCPECGDPDHGPPRVTHPDNSLWISISHTTGCVMLAVAPHEIGVDVEKQRPLRSPDLAARVLTPSERAHLSHAPDPAHYDRAFLTCWTRKEATLKAVGIGIATDLSALDSHPATPSPAHLTTTVQGPPTSWHVHDLALPDPYIAAVALPADAGSGLRLREGVRTPSAAEPPP
ncbi:4'-phosphopantetheinyl transferase [Streptomyces inusitatus]|uniref:4'-phosphopantetheinyl transferase n=1 Tax=Streptomyces inusitatus TaxID=68221 RepID=A0A918UUV7_9ACTN|nr:4'-phosphopantetheinyl transferase superfamily protein [Streptomyces inusitatus]GGZ35748.1 4'-phosphopantetheinyl transferase [Streptomyces inusitatus]